jgi:hypothetical protein
MRTELIPIDDIDVWQEYYEQVGNPGPYHRPEYIRAIAGNLGAEDDAELFIIETEEGVIYYPYFSRPVNNLPFEVDSELEEYRDIVSSWYYGGPVASDTEMAAINDFEEIFHEYCRKQKIIAEFVRFDPNIKNHETFAALQPEFDRETVWVDLNKSVNNLWDDFEKRNRNAIRQAQDTDIVVEPTSDEDDYREFYKIYKNAMDAKDASDHYRFSQSFFMNLLSNERSFSLLVALYDGEVIGGSMLTHDKYIAHDYLRASNPEYWDMRVNNLLCYEALMHMKKTGRDVFDFQGGRPGVFKFKKSFGPTRGEFHVLENVHQQEKYQRLIECAADAGIDTDTGYFPAYRGPQNE